MSWTAIGTDEIHVARKEHRCTWCGQTILPGEKYLKRRGVCEGDASTVKHHLECEKAAEADWNEYGECYDMYSQERPSQSDAQCESKRATGDL
jgi:hypothetical protein